MRKRVAQNEQLNCKLVDGRAKPNDLPNFYVVSKTFKLISLILFCSQMQTLKFFLLLCVVIFSRANAIDTLTLERYGTTDCSVRLAFFTDGRPFLETRHEVHFYFSLSLSLSLHCVSFVIRGCFSLMMREMQGNSASEVVFAGCFTETYSSMWGTSVTVRSFARVDARFHMILFLLSLQYSHQAVCQDNNQVRVDYYSHGDCSGTAVSFEYVAAPSFSRSRSHYYLCVACAVQARCEHVL